MPKLTLYEGLKNSYNPQKTIGKNYILDDELCILINSKRIKNNRFQINFLDGNKYKFNITKLKIQDNKIGNLYFKKNFGFPKFSLNNIVNTNINNTNINNTKISVEDVETDIKYSNLFFIILL